MTTNYGPHLHATIYQRSNITLDYRATHFQTLVCDEDKLCVPLYAPLSHLCDVLWLPALPTTLHKCATSSHPQRHLHHANRPTETLQPFKRFCNRTDLDRYRLLLRLRLLTVSLYKHPAITSSIIHTSIKRFEITWLSIEFCTAGILFVMNNKHNPRSCNLLLFSKVLGLLSAHVHCHPAPTFFSSQDGFNSEKRSIIHAWREWRFPFLIKIS